MALLLLVLAVLAIAFTTSGCAGDDGATGKAGAGNTASASNAGEALAAVSSPEDSNKKEESRDNAWSENPQSENPQSNNPKTNNRSAKVEIMRLEPRDFTVEAVYIGNLSPRERASIRSELEGMVELARFTEGDTVEKGQILAHVSTQRLTVRRDLARANYDLANNNYKRVKELFVKKLTPSTQLDESKNRRDVSALNVKLAEIELKKSMVASPISGRVKEKPVIVGDFLNKGQLIAEVLNLSQVRAEVNVPEREIRYIKPGRTVSVTVDALPEHTFAGVVRTVGLEADPKSRSFPVEVEIENKADQLRPGMLARVTVVLSAHRQQVLIPRHAILERQKGPTVFVAVDGKAQERVLVIGSNAGDLVQVLRGLASGELLVVTGQHKLSQGDTLEVLRELPMSGSSSSTSQSGNR